MSASTKSKSDIFMSIKPEHMGNIASGTKNHEYRGYLLPSRIRHIWFYTTAPVKRLEYVARISTGKLPGEVPEDGGLGNADFNAGKKKSKYGYEIISLWVLKEPIGLEQIISTNILKGAPQKYCWVPASLIRSRPLDEQHQLFSKTAEEDRLVESMKENEAVPAKGLESYFAKEDRREHDESIIKD